MQPGTCLIQWLRIISQLGMKIWSSLSHTCICLLLPRLPGASPRPWPYIAHYGSAKNSHVRLSSGIPSPSTAAATSQAACVSLAGGAGVRAGPGGWPGHWAVWAAHRGVVRCLLGSVCLILHNNDHPRLKSGHNYPLKSCCSLSENCYQPAAGGTVKEVVWNSV